MTWSGNSLEARVIAAGICYTSKRWGESLCAFGEMNAAMTVKTDLSEGILACNSATIAVVSIITSCLMTSGML